MTEKCKNYAKIQKKIVRYIGVFENRKIAKCPLLSDGFTPYPVGQQQNVRYSGFVRYFWSPLNWSFTVYIFRAPGEVESLFLTATGVV